MSEKVLDTLMDVGSSAVDFGFGQIAANKQAQQVKELYRKRWRWAVSDMEKAGINPILAAKVGVGASPSVALGATGQTQLGGFGLRKAGAQKATDEARVARYLSRKTAAEARTAEELARRAPQLASAEVLNRQMQWQNSAAMLNNQWLQNDMLRYGIPYAKAASDFYGTDAGRVAVAAEKVMNSGGKEGVGLLKSILGVFGK